MRPLTPRETDVLGQAAEGKTNREIAATLGIGIDSVKHHLRGCYLKLSLTTRHQAAALFRTQNLTPRPDGPPAPPPGEPPAGIDPTAWAKLPPAARRCFALRTAGLSCAAAALVLGVRPDTVKQQARLAARRLGSQGAIGK